MGGQLDKKIAGLAATALLACMPFAETAAESMRVAEGTAAAMADDICRHGDVSIIKRVPGNASHGNVVGYVMANGRGPVVATLGGGFARRTDSSDVVRREVVSVEPACKEGIALH